MHKVTHLSTAVAWREKKFKHFVFHKYFFLILGLLKSRISKKSLELLLRKSEFKLFYYTGCKSPKDTFSKINILKEPLLAQKQTISQQKALDLSFNLTP